MKIDSIIEAYPDEEFLQADGFDDAIIGVYNGKIVYSIKVALGILMKEDNTYDKSLEYFYNNIIGSYINDKMPLWIDDECLK